MDWRILILIVGFLIGLSKGGVGGPISVALALPLLSQTMGLKQAVGLTLPLLMFADIFAMRYYWKQWDMRYIRLLLPMAVVGIVIGAFFLKILPEDILKKVVGIFTLGVIVYKLASDSLRSVEYQPRDWHGYLAGGASGFASTLANLGGPPSTAYLLLQKIEPASFIGTVTLLFFVINLLKVPMYLLLGNDVLDLNLILSIIWILPIIPVGVWTGRKIIGWMNPKVFDWSLIAVLLYTSLSLLFS